MFISVILPVYNGEQYLEESILSILNQTYSNFELIIINDGSTDSSLIIIEKLANQDKRIKIIDQINQGLAKSLNNGLNLAKGNFVARMDADDIALPKRFEIQIDYLNKNPEIKLLGTNVELIDDKGKHIVLDVPFTGSKFLKKYLKTVGNPFKHPSVMFDRNIALEFGGYSEVIGKYFEDYFLWSQIANKYKIDIINVVCLKYRITPGSIMSSMKSKKFSIFMLGVINRGVFTLDDQKEMIRIKREESEVSNLSKNEIYSLRIKLTKENKMNKIFILLNKNLGYSISSKIVSFMKKLRIIKQVLEL